MEPLEELAPELTFRDYVEILLRRRWEALGVFALALVAGALITFLTTPIFSAHTKLMVWVPEPSERTRAIENPLVHLLAPAQPESVDAQIELIESDSFVEGVLRQASVERRALSVKPRNNSQGSMRNAQCSTLNAQRSSQPVVRASHIKDTNIIEVTVESPDPQLAARVANGVAQGYLEHTRQASLNEVRAARRVVDSERSHAQRALQQAEAHLAGLRRLYGVGQISNVAESATRELVELESRSRENANAITRTSAQLSELRSQLTREPERKRMPVGRANPRRDALEARLADLQAQRTALLSQYRADQPVVTAMNAQIEGMKRSLAAEPLEQVLALTAPNPAHDDLRNRVRDLDRELRGLEAERDQLAGQLAAQQERTRALGPWEEELAQLTRARDSVEKSVQSLDEKLEDLDMREKARPAAARIVERALVPALPSRPRKKLNLLLAAMIGAMLALATVFLHELLDDRITTQEAAQRILGLPVLGSVPVIPAGQSPLMTALPPQSPIADSYRWLRSALRFQAEESEAKRPPRTLLLSSVKPSEGKSLTAVNLAIAMAIEGRKVILVDADLRQPSLHRLLDLPAEPGLTSVLMDGLPIEQALQPVETPNLLVLTSGWLPPNPAEMVNSGEMEALIRRLSALADVVIFDAPPGEPVIDAQLLASRVDGVLLVADVTTARRAGLEQTIDQFEQAHGRVLGLVFNKTRQSPGYTYGATRTAHSAQRTAHSGAGRSGVVRCALSRLCAVRCALCAVPADVPHSAAGHVSILLPDYVVTLTPRRGGRTMRDTLTIAAATGGAMLLSVALMLSGQHVESERTRAVLRATQAHVDRDFRLLNARLVKLQSHPVSRPTEAERTHNSRKRGHENDPKPGDGEVVASPAAETGKGAAPIETTASPARPVTVAEQSALRSVRSALRSRAQCAVRSAQPETDPSEPRTAHRAPRTTSVASPAEAAKDETVYVRKGGRYYHRPDCRRVQRKTEPVSLAEAESDGFRPCPTCQP